MKILTKTLQNHIIREAFAKKRMSKALSVQKKIGHGPTHTHLGNRDYVKHYKTMKIKGGMGK